jgi:hypothetical protein
VLGLVISNLFCGVIAMAGKRASAPTMTISRAVFGARQPAAVGAVVAADPGLGNRVGGDSGAGDEHRLIPGTLAFDLIMKMQRWITWIASVLTAVYMISPARHMDFRAVAALPGAHPVDEVRFRFEVQGVSPTAWHHVGRARINRWNSPARLNAPAWTMVPPEIAP